MSVTTRLIPAVLVLVVLTALPAAGAEPYPRPGTTVRVSVATDGTEAVGEDADPFNHVLSVSDDGRYVAFSSEASNLVPGDNNVQRDVFVHDRLTGETERVSVRSDGGQSLGRSTATGMGSTSPSISADGRYIAFASEATNLVPGDLNGAPDVFVHDRETGETTRVSVTSSGGQAGHWSRSPSISGDGRYVAFDSAAENLVPGDLNGSYDIFVHDRQTGETGLVSVAEDGTQSDGVSYAPSISAGGRSVAFYSGATTLVAGDSGTTADVFVKDLETGKVVKASVASDGMSGNDLSYSPDISGDGRLVAFVSKASNLVPTDTNGTLDAFVHDLETGRTERVTVSSAGAQHDDQAPRPDQPFEDITLSATRPRVSLSADGRMVAFLSRAGNLAGQDEGSAVDVFVRDRLTGATERVSETPAGMGADGDAVGSPALDADGSVVAFTTGAANLVDGDGNGSLDVFARDRGPSLGVFGTTVATGAETVAVGGLAAFSGALASVTDEIEEAAGPAGADLASAAVAHRPERGDLLIRWSPTSLPALRGPGTGGNAFQVSSGVVPSVGGAPGIVYRAAFTAGGSAYEVRAGIEGASLLRCSGAVCEQVQGLEGSVGSTGVEIVAQVPLSPLGDPSALADVVLSVGPAGAAAVDEVTVGDVPLGAPAVELGLAEAGAGQPTLAPVPAEDGTFQVELDRGGLQAPVVWSRACLGEQCSPAVPHPGAA